MGEDEDIDPVYSDLFAKYTQTLNSKHEMQLSLLRSTDESICSKTMQTSADRIWQYLCVAVAQLHPPFRSSGLLDGLGRPGDGRPRRRGFLF